MISLKSFEIEHIQQHLIVEIRCLPAIRVHMSMVLVIYHTMIVHQHLLKQDQRSEDMVRWNCMFRHSAVRLDELNAIEI